jgi:hypothetical protein
MKKLILIIPLLILSMLSHAEDKSFFDEADTFFENYVTNGSVKYKAIKQDGENLESLVNQIASISIDKLDQKSQKAFYLNAYNILVIKSVVEKYPIASPMDVEGFFDKQTHKVAGKQITLNDIENKIIRPNYKDSRIHFALVCAAEGCPKIANFAFKPEKVEQQLQQLTINAMNDTQFTRVKSAEKKILLSEIFSWYKEDFLREAPNLISYVNKYRSKKVDESYEIGHYTYNWKLNEVAMN